MTGFSQLLTCISGSGVMVGERVFAVYRYKENIQFCSSQYNSDNLRVQSGQ